MPNHNIAYSSQCISVKITQLNTFPGVMSNKVKEECKSSKNLQPVWPQSWNDRCFFRHSECFLQKIRLLAMTAYSRQTHSNWTGNDFCKIWNWLHLVDMHRGNLLFRVMGIDSRCEHAEYLRFWWLSSAWECGRRCYFWWTLARTPWYSSGEIAKKRSQDSKRCKVLFVKNTQEFRN